MRKAIYPNIQNQTPNPENISLFVCIHCQHLAILKDKHTGFYKERIASKCCGNNKFGQFSDKYVPLSIYLTQVDYDKN